MIAAYVDEMAADQTLAAMKQAKKAGSFYFDDAAVVRQDAKGKVHIKETGDMSTGNNDGGDDDTTTAVTEDRAYYILPPGNYGGLPTNDDSLAFQYDFVIETFAVIYAPTNDLGSSSLGDLRRTEELAN